MDELQDTSWTRRQFVKGVVATGTGVAATAYVKPSLRSLGVPGALAQVSGTPEATPPADASTIGDPPVSVDLPGLPRTGDGGLVTRPAASEPASRLPELVGVALAGGLLGRRAVKTLRQYQQQSTVALNDEARGHKKQDAVDRL